MTQTWHITSISIKIKVRPCIRRNFPSSSFLRVSEMFGCRSSEFFWKKMEFLNSLNFCKKVWKKVWKFMLFQKFWKTTKSLSFWVKKPCFWVKKFGKSLESSEKFGNRVFQTFGNFRNFGNCSILNFPKLRKNDVKLELRKLPKTRSNSKTDSKVWLKVWNAGP